VALSSCQILILRALGLGDFLTAVPAYRALRAAFPGATVTLAAPASLRPLLPLTGAIDQLHPTAQLGQLRHDGGDLVRPDLAVNLHGSGPQSIDDLLATRPGRLITHSSVQRPRVDGPPWDAQLHEVCRWSRLLELSGIPVDASDLELSIPPAAPPVSDAIVIHPGAASPARQWPADRFGEVARQLTETGHPVVVTGTDAEQQGVQAVVRAGRLPPGSDLCGLLDLAQLAALVAAARLVISGDTGIAHLATAYGTPSVVLFGPTPPQLWGPPAGGPHTVLWHERTGDPHGREPDPGLLSIGVDEVVSAARPRLRDDGSR
jgi:ADP-heptose:LPS heptosyltransferase